MSSRAELHETALRVLAGWADEAEKREVAAALLAQLTVTGMAVRAKAIRDEYRWLIQHGLSKTQTIRRVALSLKVHEDTVRNVISPPRSRQSSRVPR